MNFFFQKMSHSAEKCKRGALWALLTYILLHNIKKIQRGDPLGTSGFVGYVKIVKNERGDPFALISADRTWPYGSSFSSVDCKKSGPIRVRL